MRRLILAACLVVTSGSSALPAAITSPGGLLVTGTLAEGGSPGRFSQAIDLRTGYTKRSQPMGNSSTLNGFDGQPWDESNGIVMVSTLPAVVAQRQARAWLDQQAWRERLRAGEAQPRRIIAPGGVPISLSFDPGTKLLREATVAGDWGPVVFRYSDWRQTGPIVYPYHREELSPVGERSVIQIETARFVPSLPKGSLTRPKWQSHAEPLPNGAVMVPYLGLGAKKAHMLVDARVNGQPVKLIFDTGAANYITTEAAPGLNIKPTGGVNLSGVGESSTTGGYATIDRIELGRAALRNETLVIGPSPFPPPAKGQPPNPAGFTGFEFLAEYITTLDYPASKIHFATRLPNPRGALRVPFYNDGSHMYVRAVINGREGMFGLDTGDGGTVAIFPAFAARAGLDRTPSKVSEDGGGVGGSVRSRPGIVQRFSLGGLNFDQLPVRFPQNKSGAFASRSLAGNLGGQILQCFRITIDFPNHLLLFDPAPQSPDCKPGGTVRRALKSRPRKKL